MSEMKTPIGTLSWTGTLEEDTLVRIDDGAEQPFSRVVSMTNGDILESIAEVQDGH